MHLDLQLIHLLLAQASSEMVSVEGWLSSGLAHCEWTENQWQNLKNGFLYDVISLSHGCGSCGCKTSPNHQPSTTVLDSWYEILTLTDDQLIKLID